MTHVMNALTIYQRTQLAPSKNCPLIQVRADMKQILILSMFLASAVVVTNVASAADDLVGKDDVIVDGAVPQFAPRGRVIVAGTFDQIVYGQDANRFRQKTDAMI